MIDVTALDPRKLDFPTIDFTNLDLSKLDVRKMELPKFDMPKFDMPKFDTEIDVPAEVDRVADVVRDVAYAGIGVCVIAVQKVDAEVRKLAAKTV